MAILKTIPTPNGVAAAHRIVKSELVDLAIKVQVHMYPSAEKAQDAHLLWQEYPVLPLSALDVQDPAGSLERALAAQEEGLFAGGVYAADPAADDIDTAKARKWAQIKAERDALESGGFDMSGLGRFDSNAESRARIVGAAMAAKIAQDAGQPYSIRWTLADNATVDLGAEDMIAVGFALLAHTDGIHQRSRQIYAQIQTAQTAEEVAGISWTQEPAEIDAAA
ncbi:DUF4376 domain-containing protein [Comamonas sp. UBA7528]|uniref:DUF4376 domain-containing protein n=1 Tax=Comamonas sp. UBA7528 TaxID=1946391 RepID=UPI0025BC7F57|nr:DUF4376 domain-containing protein [Comamonas sp. UBA7528]